MASVVNESIGQETQPPSVLPKRAARRGRRRLVFFIAVAVSLLLFVLAGLLFAIDRPLSLLFGSSVPDWRQQMAQLDAVDAPAFVSAARREALALAAQLRHRYGSDPEALFVCGLIESRFGDRAQAVRTWHRVMELVPNYVDVYLALGEEARLRGQMAKAADYFRKATELGPDRAEAFLGLGRVLIDLGENQQAVAALSQQVQLAPGSLEGWYRLGLALQGTGRLSEAKEAFLRAWRIKPDHRAVLFSLADVCDKLGQKGEATRFRREFARLEAAVRLDPAKRHTWYDDVAAAREGLAAAHVAAGRFFAARDDLSQAEEHWRRAAEVDPQNIPARAALLDRSSAESRWSEAIHWAEELEKIEPQNIDWTLQRAALLVQVRQVEQAEEAFRKVVSIAPERPDGYVGLAQLALFRGRDPQAARQYARQAVSCDPTAANYHLLAIVCERLDNLEEALTAAKRATELDPGSAQYRETLGRLQWKWRQLHGQAGSHQAEKKPQPVN
ncbi:MAG: tetratricopeptide repeat protein [Thermoguttaceae bacterium]|nr:tetratricopeptide repeat protein [Thermoguttaceae bacterium]MDW8079341.1 tetratricopeptide repeat protein [Thermoguttaceae bacterium]